MITLARSLISLDFLLFLCARGIETRLSSDGAKQSEGGRSGDVATFDDATWYSRAEEPKKLTPRVCEDLNRRGVEASWARLLQS
ncbi:hypothetical protein V6N13_024609 [Hibiscus sabdariffa]